MAAINNDWLEALKDEFGKPYYKNRLTDFSTRSIIELVYDWTRNCIRNQL